MQLIEKLRPWKTLNTCEKLIALQNELISSLREQIALHERLIASKDILTGCKDSALAIASKELADDRKWCEVARKLIVPMLNAQDGAAIGEAKVTKNVH